MEYQENVIISCQKTVNSTKFFGIQLRFITYPGGRECNGGYLLTWDVDHDEPKINKTVERQLVKELSMSELVNHLKDKTSLLFPYADEKSQEKLIQKNCKIFYARELVVCNNISVGYQIYKKSFWRLGKKIPVEKCTEKEFKEKYEPIDVLC